MYLRRNEIRSRTYNGSVCLFFLINIQNAINIRYILRVYIYIYLYRTYTNAILYAIQCSYTMSIRLPIDARVVVLTHHAIGL